MKTVRKYCTHCGSPYYYVLSGSGLLQLNDEHYCKDCKKVIIDALSKVKRRYITKFKETTVESNVKNTFNQLLRGFDESVSIFIKYVNLDYDEIWEVEYQGRTYAFCKNKNDEEYKTFVLSDFNIESNSFEGEHQTNSEEITLIACYGTHRIFNSDVEATNLPKPLGEVFYMNPILS